MKCLCSIALLCILLIGCETTRDPSTGRFVTNDSGVVLTPTRLKQVQGSWRNDAIAVFGDSKAGKRDASWTVDFIATTEAHGISPCTDLRAVERKALPLSAFTIYDAFKKQRREYSPKHYNEAWLVEACGKRREWRVLDDPEDPENPHTVLLWSTG